MTIANTQQPPGYLGIESARKGVRLNYKTRICKVERDYGLDDAFGARTAVDSA